MCQIYVREIKIIIKDLKYFLIILIKKSVLFTGILTINWINLNKLYIINVIEIINIKRGEK